MRVEFSDKKFGATGSAFMLTFGAIAIWRWLQTDMLFFLLFALRDFAAAAFMYRRHEARLKAPGLHQTIAYVSTAMPLFYQPPSHLVPPMIMTAYMLMAIGGFTLATLATIELGYSFGISPANRGTRILTGVYRHLRHPMYTGYMIAEFGLVLVNPQINLILYFISMGLYAYRARLESLIVNQVQKNPDKNFARVSTKITSIAAWNSNDSNP